VSLPSGATHFPPMYRFSYVTSGCTLANIA